MFTTPAPRPRQTRTASRRSIVMRVIARTACGFAVSIACCGASALAAPLTGTGTNLTFPNGNKGVPNGVFRTLVANGNTSFTGTWSAGINPNWLGTYNGTGPALTSTKSGTAEYDFSGLAKNVLPKGTYFVLGDVDRTGGQGESVLLEARDSNGNSITTPWLNDPYGAVNNSGTLLGTHTPGWLFAPTAGTYTKPSGGNINLNAGAYYFDGESQTGGNPNVGVYLRSNKTIASMTATKPTLNNSFALMAPRVPEPGTGILLLCGGLASIARRRRR